MCGRYSLTSPDEAMRQLFDLPAPNWLQPRFNIAPSQVLPVVRHGRDGTMELSGMTWGLIPSWSRDGASGKGQINARSETAAEKPMFRSAYRRRRCLVPADGFYEWQKLDGGKQPYWIARADLAPFAFAGLWETWTDGKGDEIVSFAILTTEASPDLRAIHHRMPVILAPENFAAWLDPEQLPQGELFSPDQAPEMQTRKVSRRVNSPRNDDAGCLQPADERPAQRSLF